MERKVLKKIMNHPIFLVIMLMAFVISCGTSVKITRDSMKTDAEKDDFIKSNTQLSHLHRGTQGLYLNKIDASRLNGKTAAILFADFVMTTNYTVTGKHAKFCANGIADSIMDNFSKIAHLKFLPYEKVTQNPKYVSLNFEEKSEGGVFAARASAYNLKYLNYLTMQIRPKYVVEKMAEIAKELNVDYVIAVRVEATIGERTLAGTVYPAIMSLTVDMIDQEKVAWSFSVPKQPFIGIGGINDFKGLIGEEVKFERGLWGDKTVEEADKFFKNLIEVFDRVAEISAYKFVKDKMQ